MYLMGYDLLAPFVFQVSTPNFFCALRKGKVPRWGTSIWAETVGSSLLLMIWPGGNVFIVFIMKITKLTEQSRRSTWDHSPCGYLIGLFQYTSDVIETLCVWLIFARWYLCIFLLKIKEFLKKWWKHDSSSDLQNLILKETSALFLRTNKKGPIPFPVCFVDVSGRRHRRWCRAPDSGTCLASLQFVVGTFLQGDGNHRPETGTFQHEKKILQVYGLCTYTKNSWQMEGHMLQRGFLLGKCSQSIWVRFCLIPVCFDLFDSTKIKIEHPNVSRKISIKHVDFSLPLCDWP